jgi:predicted nucleic acid-binding Zn ribbon protein
MRNCPECGDKILGREDKKFCSDSCRNNYNNRINKDATNLMRNINNKLRKNYRILSDTNTEGKTKPPKPNCLAKVLTSNILLISSTQKPATPTTLSMIRVICFWTMIYMLVKKINPNCYETNQLLHFQLSFITIVIGLSFYFMMPQSYDTTEAPLSEFSTQRAFAKVKTMSAKPHFVGSKNHEAVAQY